MQNKPKPVSPSYWVAAGIQPHPRSGCRGFIRGLLGQFRNPSGRLGGVAGLLMARTANVDVALWPCWTSNLLTECSMSGASRRHPNGRKPAMQRKPEPRHSNRLRRLPSA
jgi:hypothetical protein